MRRLDFCVCMMAMCVSAPLAAQEREADLEAPGSREDARLCCDAGGEEPLWSSVKGMVEDAAEELVDELFAKMCELGEIVDKEGCNGGLM